MDNALVTVQCSVVGYGGWQAPLAAGLRLFGKRIALATSRDSGATYHDDVVLRKGYITSGGSLHDWVTTITRGSVFDVYNVQPELLERSLPSALRVRVIDVEARIQLTAERAALASRMAEIDAALKKI